MQRHDIIETIGRDYLTVNIENDEYSYVVAAGSKAKLEKKVGHPVKTFQNRFTF